MNMLLGVTLCLYICSPIYSLVSFPPSDIHLRPYLDTLKEVVNQLEEVYEDRRKRLDLVKAYLEHLGGLSDDGQTHLGKAINRFILLYNLTKGLDSVQVIIKGKRVFKKDPSLPYPLLDDLEVHVMSLSRLQRFYKLNVTQLAAGILKTKISDSGKVYVEHFTKLTSSDCYAIGRIMSKHERHGESVQWLVEALRLYDTDKAFYEFTKKRIYLSLCRAYENLGDSKNVVKWARELSKNAKYEDQKMLAAIAAHESKMERDALRHASTPKQSKQENLNIAQEAQRCLKSKETVNYRNHCRGKMRVSTEITKRLNCWYSTGYHPFLRLAPIRTEQLYVTPDIFLHHDVITHKEIENITMYQGAQLNECSYNKCLNNTVKGCLPNIGFRHCLVKTINSSADSISQRIFDFTGLRSAEFPLFAQYYSNGGHFNTHTDSSKTYDFSHYTTKTEINGTKINKEDLETLYTLRMYRVQTVLFYLSNVTQGGATVFPVLGLTVFPKKGSALTWTTMYPSTNNDVTCHSACPVLRGNKWVATKWVNYYGNELRRPCVHEFPNGQPKDIHPPVPRVVYFKKY